MKRASPAGGKAAGSAGYPQFHRSLLLHAVLFLFFFQLITDFVEAIYAFGLLGTDIPPELGYILLLLSPGLLLFVRQEPAALPAALPAVLPGEAGLAFLGLLVVISRLVEVELAQSANLVGAGIGTALFLLYLPLRLWCWGQSTNEDQAQGQALALGGGLALGSLLAILMRALGSGIDLSTDGTMRWKGWLLAALAIFLLLDAARRKAPIQAQIPQPGRGSGFGRLLGLGLGMTGCLAMIYIAFSSPNVIARWTGASFAGVTALTVGALVGSLFLRPCRRPDRAGARWLDRVGKGRLLLWNLLFGLALVVTILLYQVQFPADASGFPLVEPLVPAWARLPLGVMLMLWPLTWLNFSLFTGELIHGRPGVRVLGGVFALCGLTWMLVILGHVFTTVYDYIPVVGPFFRDRFWLVHLVVVTMMVLGVLVWKGWASQKPIPTIPPVYAALGGVIGLLAILGPLVNAARPVEANPQPPVIRILTYNIQQGYSEQGLKAHDPQLELIRSLQPDLIGLQESDTNRIANGNTDVVRYFSERLGMYEYYSPKTVVGTFGLALLSRYPLEAPAALPAAWPRTFYMYSEGEQTAAIHARVTIGGVSYNVIVTHLGNGGPLVQQENVLAETRGLENVILMGDFNFRPDTEQYARTVEIFADSWLLRWPEGKDDQGVDPVDRIDHIFLSPGLNVLEARYIHSPVSDHPAYWIELEPAALSAAMPADLPAALPAAQLAR